MGKAKKNKEDVELRTSPFTPRNERFGKRKAFVKEESGKIEERTINSLHIKAIISPIIKKLNRKVDRNRYSIELAIYIVFVTIFVTVFFQEQKVFESLLYIRTLSANIEYDELPPIPSDRYAITFKGGFLNQEEVWRWLKGPLYNTIYDSDTIRYDQGDDYKRKVVNFNRLIGGVRLRQLRTDSTSCLDSTLKNEYDLTECYARYSPGASSKESYGPNNTYVYWDQEKTKNTGDTGIFDTNYDGAGFVQDLPKVSDSALQRLNELQESGWINKGTRVVFVQFYLYNPSLDTYVSAKYLVEFEPSGGIYTFKYYVASGLRSYFQTEPAHWLLLRIIFICAVLAYIVYYFFSLVWFVRQNKTRIPFAVLQYMTKFWNLIELVSLCFFVTALAYRIARQDAPDEDDLLESKVDYVPLDTLFDGAFIESNIHAFNIFLCFIKTFKYLKLSKYLSLPWVVMSKAFFELMSLVLFSVLIVLGFALCGYAIYGGYLHSWRDMPAAGVSLLDIAIGNGNYNELYSANRYLTGPFYFSFMLIVYFILFNMFIAVLDAAYDAVREMIQPDNLKTNLKTNLKLLIYRLQGKKKSKNIELEQMGFTDETEDAMFLLKKFETICEREVKDRNLSVEKWKVAELQSSIKRLVNLMRSKTIRVKELKSELNDIFGPTNSEFVSEILNLAKLSPKYILTKEEKRTKSYALKKMAKQQDEILALMTTLNYLVLEDEEIDDPDGSLYQMLEKSGARNTLKARIAAGPERKYSKSTN